MKINLIAAMSEHRVIGKDGDIPWKLSDDLKRFKKITMGHPIIMGRKTFESIGRTLPGRENIVLTRQKDYRRKGVTVFNDINSLTDTLKFLAISDVFVIGGEEVYEAFLPTADKLYLTVVTGEYEGDAFFPPVEWNEFKEIDAEMGEGEPKHVFLILERKSNEVTQRI